MTFQLNRTEFNKKGWQDNRPSELKGCDVAKSLDAFVPLWKKGPARVFGEGKMDEALAKSTALSKALGKAKVKANKIKKAPSKRTAIEIVEAFESFTMTFVDSLLTENLSNSGKVLEQVMLSYKNDADAKIEKVVKTIRDTQAAIRKPDAEAAVRQHGIALNYLKGVTPLATKSGLEASVKRAAGALNVPMSEVDMKDKKLQTVFKKTAKRYKELTAEVDQLDDECERLAEALASRDPVTASADPTYKKRLKKMSALYKGVVDDAKKGLAKVKQFSARIKKLPQVIEGANATNATKVVQAVEMMHDGMHDAYSKVDSHIQQTIRTKSSTFVVQRAEWGITTEDVTKNLAPLMNRAFALNYQCKAVWENGTDDLVGMLEDLLEKIDSAEARRAMARLKKA